MLKNMLLAAASVSATLAMSTAASAVPITIDDFSTDTFGPVNLVAPGDSATEVPAGTPNANTTRTLLFERMANGGNGATPTADATLNIANGYLSLDNDQGVVSRLTLSYDITDLINVGGITSFSIFGNDNGAFGASTISATLNGFDLGTRSLSDGFSGPLTFSFTDAQASPNPDMLTFVINGSAGYDLTLNGITANVPEPGAIGLMGLGLLGLGVAARRRKAA